jgi:hypothetical protein
LAFITANYAIERIRRQTMPEATETYTVEDHFTGKAPAVREIYGRLLDLLRDFGPVAEEAKKTSIHLVNRSALAGVYTRREYINLEFKTDYPITSDRISKTEQISKNRYHHALRLDSADQLHGEVLEWLRDAYNLSA